MLKNKITKALSLMIILTLIPISSSFADDSTGGGGSSGSGTASGFQWNTVVGKVTKADGPAKGDTSGSAWRRFKAAQDSKEIKWAGYDKGVEGSIKRFNANYSPKIDLNVCKNADQIWWMTSTNGSYAGTWTQNFNHGASFAKTKPYNYSGGGVKNRGGRDVTEDDYAKFKGIKKSIYDLKEAGKLSLVCFVIDPGPQPDPNKPKDAETRIDTETDQRTNTYTEYEYKTPEKKKETTVLSPQSSTYTSPNAVISTTVVAQRQNLRDENGVIQNKDIIGKANLENQAAVVKDTPYGTLLKNIASKATTFTKVEDLKKAIDDAIKKYPEFVNAVTLSEKNKDGLAEGGVLNVKETETYASISVSLSNITTKIEDFEIEKYDVYTVTENESRSRTRPQTRTKVYNTKEYKWEWGPWTNGSWSKWSKWKHDAGSPKRVKTQSNVSGKKTKIGENNIVEVKVNNGGTVNVDNVIKPKAFYQILSVHCNPAGVAKLVKALTDAGKEPSKVNTGDSSGEISTLLYSKVYANEPATKDFGQSGDSASISFYNKECGFECIAAPSGSTAPAEARKNINNTVKAGNEAGFEGLYGAQSENVSGNQFTFFRDNQNKPLRVDLWYPANAKGVQYNRTDSAVTTTITRWSGGTPGVNSSSGGKFEMTTKDGKTKLFTGKDSVKTQKNWTVDKFSNSTSTILDGQHNEFLLRSTWASDKNKPQKLNIKWEYRPTVKVDNVPAQLGFKNGTRIISNQESVSTAKIDGKCYAEFGTAKSSSTVTDFNTYTGSGTTNELDKNVNSSKTARNLEVLFVRGASE